MSQNQNINLKIGHKSKNYPHFLEKCSNFNDDWFCHLCDSDYKVNTGVRFGFDENNFDFCLKSIL